MDQIMLLHGEDMENSPVFPTTANLFLNQVFCGIAWNSVDTSNAMSVQKYSPCSNFRLTNQSLGDILVTSTDGSGTARGLQGAQELGQLARTKTLTIWDTV